MIGLTASVEENLFRAGRFGGAGGGDLGIADLIAEFGLARHLHEPSDKQPYGLQKMLGLVMELAARRRFPLLDEPFLGLAPVWIGRISEAIRQLRRRGTTILMTEQMARPALKPVDRANVIRGGAVRRSGTVAEIREAALAEEYL